MKSVLAILCLCWALVNVKAQTICSYQSEGDGGYKASWAYDAAANQVQFSIEAKQRLSDNFWTGIGFGKNMKSADMIIVANIGEQMTVSDRHSESYHEPLVDTQQDVNGFSGRVENGIIYANFSRLINTGDPNDKPLEDPLAQNCQHFIFPTSGGPVAGDRKSYIVEQHINTPKIRLICNIARCRSSTPAASQQLPQQQAAGARPIGVAGGTGNDGNELGSAPDAAQRQAAVPPQKQPTETRDPFETPRRPAQTGQGKLAQVQVQVQDSQSQGLQAQVAGQQPAGAQNGGQPAPGQPRSGVLTAEVNQQQSGGQPEEAAAGGSRTQQVRPVGQTTPTVSEVQPTCEFADGRYRVEWTYNEQTQRITFNLTAPMQQARWTGIGFGQQMRNGDMIIIQDSRGRLQITDRHGTGHEEPLVDDHQDFEAFKGAVEGGILRATFDRLLNTLDPEDLTIDDPNLNNCQHFIFPVTGGGQNELGKIQVHDTIPKVKLMCNVKKCKKADGQDVVSSGQPADGQGSQGAGQQPPVDGQQQQAQLSSNQVPTENVVRLQQSAGIAPQQTIGQRGASVAGQDGGAPSDQEQGQQSQQTPIQAQAQPRIPVRPSQTPDATQQEATSQSQSQSQGGAAGQGQQQAPAAQEQSLIPAAGAQPRQQVPKQPSEQPQEAGAQTQPAVVLPLAKASPAAHECPQTKEDHDACKNYVDDYLNVVYSKFPRTEIITQKACTQLAKHQEGIVLKECCKYMVTECGEVMDKFLPTIRNVAGSEQSNSSNPNVLLPVNTGPNEVQVQPRPTTPDPNQPSIIDLSNGQTGQANGDQANTAQQANLGPNGDQRQQANPTPSGSQRQQPQIPHNPPLQSGPPQPEVGQGLNAEKVATADREQGLAARVSANQGQGPTLAENPNAAQSGQGQPQATQAGEEAGSKSAPAQLTPSQGVNPKFAGAVPTTSDQQGKQEQNPDQQLQSPQSQVPQDQRQQVNPTPNGNQRQQPSSPAIQAQEPSTSQSQAPSSPAVAQPSQSSAAGLPPPSLQQSQPPPSSVQIQVQSQNPLRPAATPSNAPSGSQEPQDPPQVQAASVPAPSAQATPTPPTDTEAADEDTLSIGTGSESESPKATSKGRSREA